jgi:hypothetical protein
MGMFVAMIIKLMGAVWLSKLSACYLNKQNVRKQTLNANLRMSVIYEYSTWS